MVSVLVSLLTILALSSTLNDSVNAAEREILLRRTFWAVAWVESRGDPRAFNRSEQAAGIVQIRPIMLADANRIIGWQRWTPADRFDVEQSWHMFRVVCRYYAPQGTPEQWARIWNGGPRGMKKANTIAYWLKVKGALAQLERP